MSEFVQHKLANGLNVVIEVMPGVTSAAAGFFARTGARDETPELAGVSHFLEHMCFKGTPRRNWRELNIAFDELGSQYNAYTMKDRTFYYGWVPAENIEDQIELLADMMRSTLPPDELETERKVILEEIAMSKDHIENLSYEFMHEQVFPSHPLRWPILGYDETVKDMSQGQMKNYFDRRYASDNLTLIVAGKVNPQRIVDAAERLCGTWSPAHDAGSRKAPHFAPGASCKVLERFNQQIIARVFITPGGADPDDETAEVVASILGGENSRFYWHIVQQGIAPRADAWRVDYAECGLLMLSGQCEPQHCERLAGALAQEAERVSREGVSDQEVQRVKNRRRTTIALESEAPYYRLGQLLDDVDYRKRPRTIEQRLQEIDAITPESVADYLRRYPITTGGHFISVGPRNWLAEN